MKTIKDYISEHKISESNMDDELLDELSSAVENWFDWHCRKDAYDSTSEWRKDLKYIAKKQNDFATSECIDYISDDFDDDVLDKHYDDIEDMLAKFAKDALDHSSSYY